MSRLGDLLQAGNAITPTEMQTHPGIAIELRQLVDYLSATHDESELAYIIHRLAGRSSKDIAHIMGESDDLLVQNRALTVKDFVDHAIRSSNRTHPSTIGRSR